MVQIKEIDIQNSIRLALSEKCVIFRANVGVFSTADGRTVPKGFSDLFGYRKSDCKAVFIEVKTATGKVRPQQEQFLNAMKNYGAIAGVCRSAEEALKLIDDG